MVGNFVYKTLFKVFRLALARRLGLNKEFIWYRNSLVFGRALFLKSDIDVTVLVPAALRDSKSLVRGFWWFPLVREINVYSEDTIRAHLRLINPIELKRDPILCNRFAGLISHRKVSPAQMFVFLARMLEVQRSWNKRKMGFYLFLAGIGTDANREATLAEYLECLCRLVPSEPLRGEFFLFLQEVFQESSLDPAKLCERTDLSGSFARLRQSCFPHRFAYEKWIGVEEGFLSEVFLEQVSWELWGIWTQANFLQNYMQVRTHLSNLEAWVRQVPDSDFALLLDAFPIVRGQFEVDPN